MAKEGFRVIGQIERKCDNMKQRVTYLKKLAKMNGKTGNENEGKNLMKSYKYKLR